MAAGGKKVLATYLFDQATQKFLKEIGETQPITTAYVEFVNAEKYTLDEGVFLLQKFLSNVNDLPHTLRGGLYRLPVTFEVNSHPLGPKLTAYFHKLDAENVQKAKVKVPTVALVRLAKTAEKLGGPTQAPIWVLKALKDFFPDSLAWEIEEHELYDVNHWQEGRDWDVEENREAELIEERRTPPGQDQEEDNESEIEEPEENQLQDNYDIAEVTQPEDLTSESISTVEEYSLQDIEEELGSWEETANRGHQLGAARTDNPNRVRWWSDSEGEDEYIWDSFQRNRGYTDTESPGRRERDTSLSNYSSSDTTSSLHRQPVRKPRGKMAYQTQTKPPRFRGEPHEDWPEFLHEVEQFFTDMNIDEDEKLGKFTGMVKDQAKIHLRVGTQSHQCATYADAIKFMNERYGKKYGSMEDYQRIYSMEKKKTWTVAKYFDKLSYFMKFKPDTVRIQEVSDLIVKKVKKELPEPVQLRLDNYMRGRENLAAHNFCANVKACIREMKHRKKYEREIFGYDSDTSDSDSSSDEERDEPVHSKKKKKDGKGVEQTRVERLEKRLEQLEAEKRQKEESTQATITAKQTENPSKPRNEALSVEEVVKQFGDMCIIAQQVGKFNPTGRDKYSGNNRGNYNKKPPAHVMPSSPMQGQPSFQNQWQGAMPHMQYQAPAQMFQPTAPPFQPPPPELNQWATMDLAQQFQQPPQHSFHNPGQYFEQPPMQGRNAGRGGYQNRGPMRCYFCNTAGHRQAECPHYHRMRSETRWNNGNKFGKKN